MQVGDWVERKRPKLTANTKGRVMAIKVLTRRYGADPQPQECAYVDWGRRVTVVQTAALRVVRPPLGHH